MPLAARKGDKFATGHLCTTVSTLNGTINTTVTYNGIPAQVQGDKTAVHTYLVGDVCKPHTEKISGGSSTVFIGGIPAARKNDAVDAGSITGHSPDVFIGG